VGRQLSTIAALHEAVTALREQAAASSARADAAEAEGRCPRDQVEELRGRLAQVEAEVHAMTIEAADMTAQLKAAQIAQPRRRRTRRSLGKPRPHAALAAGWHASGPAWRGE
jgi:predicted  nucleic acid-binding Zn-ribbon protein